MAGSPKEESLQRWRRGGAPGRWAVAAEGGEEEIGKDGWAVGRWRWVVSSAAPEPPIGMEDVGRGRGGRRLQLRRDESQ